MGWHRPAHLRSKLLLDPEDVGHGVLAAEDVEILEPKDVAARPDAMLDFLIGWHLASGAEGRPQVMASLRRRVAGPDHVDGPVTGPRLSAMSGVCTGMGAG